jgi:ribosomal protein L3 glutamine methyltransferase
MPAESIAQQLRCIRDLLRYAVSRFNQAGLNFGHGSDNAYDEAAYLILHTLHLPLDRLEPFFDAVLLPEEILNVLSVIERRVSERLPAAYITQEAWLEECRFYVDERVIVPRSHIAELIGEGFTTWLPDSDKVKRALDLCTGSGCLAILLALAFPGATVDGADVSVGALQVARRNVDDYGLSKRVKLVQSDLFDGLVGTRYQLIVSNPPYVDEASMRSLPQEYQHEPVQALAGGKDGLDLVRRILEQARKQLSPGGVLVVEIGNGRQAVEAAFPDLQPTWLETRAGGDQVFLIERDQLPA